MKRRRSCPLCGIVSELEGPVMVHPADTVCNHCLASLWADSRPEADIEAELAAMVSSDRGIEPTVVASGITSRMRQLRELVASDEELHQLLDRRDPRWRERAAAWAQA